MDIILKQDVINLGYKNDIVNVKPGYGRNFLIPQGLAILATERNRKILAEEMRQQAHKEQKIKDEATEKAKALEGLKLQIQGSHRHRSGPQAHRPQRRRHQGSGRLHRQD